MTKHDFYRFARMIEGARPSDRKYLLKYLQLAEAHGVFDRRG